MTSPQNTRVLSFTRYRTKKKKKRKDQGSCCPNFPDFTPDGKQA